VRSSSFAVHVAPSFSSRRSHALATSHFRFAVAGDTPSAAAVSAMCEPSEVAQLDEPRLLGVERREDGRALRARRAPPPRAHWRWHRRRRG
jgi:hypothetical protein